MSAMPDQVTGKCIFCEQFVPDIQVDSHPCTRTVLTAITDAIAQERQRCARVVEKLLNECDRYEPRTDAQALEDALKEINADGE